MAHPTIDMCEALQLFHQLMQPDSNFRVLRLLGQAKLGKSHLVAKVFPKLADEKYNARFAVLDLRSKTQTVLDLMQTAHMMLGGPTSFPSYSNAYQEWIHRPKVNISSMQTFFSSLWISPKGEADEVREMARHLNTHFVNDLANLADEPLLFLFDAVNDTDDVTRDWLMYTLLPQLLPLKQVRVVVAGQVVPEAAGSYAGICYSYELRPVEEAVEYVAYCRQIGAEIGEAEIRALARAFDYRPGAFADVMPKFKPLEVIRG